MEQLETLFDTGSSAWRLDIAVKGGGGPFDPAGFSIRLINASDNLVAMEVTKVESEELPVTQVCRLLHLAAERLEALAAVQLELTRERKVWEASARARRNVTIGTEATSF